jgi:DNA-binding response OmpR family regulator
MWTMKAVATKKVLIIEDDPVQLRVLTGGLAAAGFEVAVARDGVQAVAMARKEGPHLVLLDIGLPGGNGYVVMHRLRSIAASASVPILAVSAMPAETEREKMLALGAADYFQKPVSLAPLVGRIKELVGVD